MTRRAKHERALEMQSAMMTFVRHRDRASKTFKLMVCMAAIGFTALALAVSPASALTGADSALHHQFKQGTPFLEVVARPAPGQCWYYSDPGRTRGFRDICP
jgi:hypothetical protein